MKKVIFLKIAQTDTHTHTHGEAQEQVQTQYTSLRVHSYSLLDKEEDENTD